MRDDSTQLFTTAALLISPYWNVNTEDVRITGVAIILLISPYWNVNTKDGDGDGVERETFNLSILECKSLSTSAAMRAKMLLISPYWNVNKQTPHSAGG